jgi:hypothetical protein
MHSRLSHCFGSAVPSVFAGSKPIETLEGTFRTAFASCTARIRYCCFSKMSPFPRRHPSFELYGLYDDAAPEISAPLGQQLGL